jgi:hypothetical protein
MYMNFTDFINQLVNMGVADVLLPFMLIFTVVFAVFQKASILGKDKKNMNVVIALVLALAVIIPHVTGSYPAGSDVVNIINQALPNVSLVVVAILMVLLLAGVFGWEFAGGSLSGFVAIFCVGIVIYIFGAAAGWWSRGALSWLNIDASTQALLIVIAVFGIIIWFVTSTGEKKSQGANIMHQFGELFQKPGGKQ